MLELGTYPHHPTFSLVENLVIKELHISLVASKYIHHELVESATKHDATKSE